MGTQKFCVTEGYIVDSIKIMSSFFKFFPTVIKASFKNFKSGSNFLSTGVGTAIIKKLDFFIFSTSLVITELFFNIKSFLLNSLFLSCFFNKKVTLFLSVSKPMVENLFFNLIKRGKPT